MARAMDSLAADPDRARELGEQGRQWVAERFTRRRIEPALLGLYQHSSR
jgi:glycosyltransferase involved in cell wall biosynthesis